jgi:uncharacterized membrane protein YqjE
MESVSIAASGFLNSLRSFGDGVLASAQHRLELFGGELQEQKLRLIQSLIWMSAALFAGMMAIAFASVTLVYLFQESARPWVLGGLTTFYAAATVVTVLVVRHYLTRQPHPFASTLHELEEDRACIRAKN